MLGDLEEFLRGLLRCLIITSVMGVLGVVVAGCIVVIIKICYFI